MIELFEFTTYAEIPESYKSFFKPVFTHAGTQSELKNTAALFADSNSDIDEILNPGDKVYLTVG